jgi:hypothetical protein
VLPNRLVKQIDVSASWVHVQSAVTRNAVK